jgi:hypothetical protein
MRELMPPRFFFPHTPSRCSTTGRGILRGAPALICCIFSRALGHFTNESSGPAFTSRYFIFWPLGDFRAGVLTGAPAFIVLLAEDVPNYPCTAYGECFKVRMR